MRFIDSTSKEYGTMSNMVGSAKRFLIMALETQSSHGISNDDKRSAVETLQVAMVETPDGDPNTPSPSREIPKTKSSLRAKAQLFGIPLTIYIRNNKIAKKKRLELKLNKNGVLWSSVTKKIKWSKITS